MMHQTGRELKDILQLSQSRIGQSQPDSRFKGASSHHVPSRHTSITILTVFCYVSYIQVCARYFSDLCTSLRLDPSLRTRTGSNHFHEDRSPAAKDPMLDMMKSLIDHPVCYIYAAMKSIIKLIQTIELLMELQPIAGLRGMDGLAAENQSALQEDDDPAGHKAGQSCDSHHFKPSLSTRLVNALIEDEDYGDQKMRSCAVLQSCVEETRELMKSHLDL